MKVTATGVSEATGMKMFELWIHALSNAVNEMEGVDVRFIMENENGRT